MTQYAGLPSRQQILDFIAQSDRPADKREIAKAFGIRGPQRAALKALLRDMADEGLIDSGERGRAFHKMGGLPKVTVLEVVSTDDGQVVAVPQRWEAENTPIPRLRIMERKGKGALGIGDRILARTEERGKGWIAHPMKKLPRASETMLGVVAKGENGRFWLRPLEKKARRDVPISDLGEARDGQLVRVERGGRSSRAGVKVVEILGDPFAPRSFSLIAIEKFGIPNVFLETVEDEAQAVSELPITTDRREDLRHLPIVAIDPADARDHDDAIWAAPDDDPENKGGFRAIVAIADVSYYVRSGSALDKEAKKRGNSVYFPDRVVPMLPHSLSSDKCSLKAGEDRAALVCHMVIGKDGALRDHRFTRAVVRLGANIAYEDAQAAIDGRLDHPLTDSALRPLWNCWTALKAARDKRGPLELDLPERQVMLNDAGEIAEIRLRERLDAHRLIEDYMIAANVAAAKALERKKSPLIYRVHEPPSREKLVALRDYLKTHDVEFALGQVIQPEMFNRIIERVGERETLPEIMEQILRSQTQAYYAPGHGGHFGLALGSYAHFTSPIRRYADLIVHRALVRAFGLEQARPTIDGVKPETGLSDAEIETLEATAEAISRTERRAMEAERETIDRYVAAHLSARVGDLVDARISGVKDFGFFATVEGLGGDGLVPVSTLGDDYFRYDEAAQALVADGSDLSFRHGQRLKLRLVEANPVSGSLRFALPDGEGSAPSTRREGRGRPDRDRSDRGKGPRGGRPRNIPAGRGKKPRRK